MQVTENTNLKELVPDRSGGVDCDNPASACRAADNTERLPFLPREARLPINRCNLPAQILGGITFQRHPTALEIDGVAVLHPDLFRRLDSLDDGAARGMAFRDYLTVHFCLENLDEAGLDAASGKRGKANWMRLLRGWSFDSDGREGAVLKGWVESRFGLLPRFHGQPLRDYAEPAYMRYLEMRAHGLYGTNALEAQLDLVYAYSQYEYQRSGAAAQHLLLYRGINRLAEHETLWQGEGGRQVVLLNSLNSFTSSRERAGEFGDYIVSALIPLAKVFFHCALLPGVLKGEDEYLVIGGACEVRLSTY
jgi:NAD+--dinitrogen-reductase ADP-D-ribosyltransferase